MSIRLSLLAATTALLTGPALAQATQQELQDTLVGNTFQGDMGGGGYSSYFAEDGTYYDASGSGSYEITEDGVCYPDTEFGCYQAEIDGMELQWSQDGEDMGSGVILENDPLGLMEE